MMDATHWCAVINPLTQEQRINMDECIAFLHGVDIALSNYFKKGDFTHLQFGKGSGQGMLSCLIEILKGNKSTVLLATILKSTTCDRNIQSNLRTYLRTHVRKIFNYVTSEPNGSSIPTTLEDLTVHDLARYLAFRRWGGMTAAQRLEETKHLRSEEVHAKRMESLAKLTAAQRLEATKHLRSEEVHAKRMESLATNRRTFEEQVDRLAAYLDIYGNCHVPQEYKDDTMLANWVMRVRQGKTKLNKEQKQILDAMGFAWNIAEINESKRQQRVLVVRLILFLLSLSHNFTNNLSHSGE